MGQKHERAYILPWFESSSMAKTMILNQELFILFDQKFKKSQPKNKSFFVFF